MSIKEACEILEIPEFSTRIFNSNSHGELMHLWWYFEMAEKKKSHPEEDWSFFRPLFIECVEFAEKNWKRPESCFQWMDRLMAQAAGVSQEHTNER